MNSAETEEFAEMQKAEESDKNEDWNVTVVDLETKEEEEEIQRRERGGRKREYFQKRIKEVTKTLGRIRGVTGFEDLLKRTN